MILFDTETTGLVKKGNTPILDQPHIIEFAAIKLSDDTLEEIERIQFLCKPPEHIKLEPIITNITGLNDEMLSTEKPFSAYLETLQKFFFGTWTMVAHNLPFDRNMLGFELKRLNMTANFPWPPKHICTVEKSFDIEGYRLNLTKLHEKATGQEHINNAHRAINDVEALVKCLKYLRSLGKL